jgi:hypothetical protein
MRRQQQGSILTLVLLGILAVGVLATLAYGSYYQIARGTLDTVNRAHSSALLTQAAYTLATEASDTDMDGTAEPPAGGSVLNDGWEIPATSGSPKVDAWGSKIMYCPWDNGSVNNPVAHRKLGANPALPNSIQFALVSAGPDKTFNTSCVQAQIGANGDDGVRTMSVTQLNQGVGNTYFYGDPVANLAALTALTTTGLPPGMIRVTQDTQISYIWSGASWLPLNAGAWVDGVAGAGTNCSDYLSGTLARAADENLYMCTKDKKWKKMSI